MCHFVYMLVTVLLISLATPLMYVFLSSLGHVDPKTAELRFVTDKLTYSVASSYMVVYMLMLASECCRYPTLLVFLLVGLWGDLLYDKSIDSNVLLT